MTERTINEYMISTYFCFLFIFIFMIFMYFKLQLYFMHVLLIINDLRNILMDDVLFFKDWIHLEMSLSLQELLHSVEQCQTGSVVFGCPLVAGISKCSQPIIW